jgi:hypothetical protein
MAKIVQARTGESRVSGASNDAPAKQRRRAAPSDGTASGCGAQLAFPPRSGTTARRSSLGFTSHRL